MSDKILIMFFTAVFINTGFIFFWKKSMLIASPPVFVLAISLFTFIVGLLSIKFFGWKIVSYDWHVWWVIPFGAFIVTFMYLFMGYVLTTQNISKIYPLLSVMTIILVSLVGWFFLKEPMTIKKIIGIIGGVISIYIILS